MIGYLIYGLVTDGFSDGRGMAILVFQALGAVASIATLLFSGIGFAMNRPARTGFAKIGALIGVLGLVTLGAMMFF